MLWVRSASFTRITRMSRAIASSILRKFSACFSSRDVKLIWPIFVTPSTSVAISVPKSDSTWSSVASVSSTVSWRSPVAMLGTSSRMSAMMLATESGWVRYGSPDARRCPLWTFAENS
jgi:hypothetical protein